MPEGEAEAGERPPGARRAPALLLQGQVQPPPRPPHRALSEGDRTVHWPNQGELAILRELRAREEEEEEEESLEGVESVEGVEGVEGEERVEEEEEGAVDGEERVEGEANEGP